MKVSIIIPTYQKLEQCFKPCLNSALKHLSLKHDYEIIVVANGCTDGTQKFVKEQKNERIKLLDYPEALGATKALNKGISNANGDIVVLLNNDIKIFGKVDEWLDILLEPFSDDKVSIVGAEKRWHDMGGGYVIPFFCAAIRKSILDEFNNLDEIFSPGTCEDVDFCRKAEKAGYKLIQKNIPVSHDWQSTMSTIKNISDICKRNDQIVFERHNKAKVSIVIATYNHLDDCLKPCIESIKKYCNLDNKEVIVVANGCNDGTKKYVEGLGTPFRLLWYDEAIGAARAYNAGIKEAKYDYILLLNNDVTFLDQKRDEVINMHLVRFSDPKVGIVGPIKSISSVIDREFIIFFCAMIRKEVFDKIGYLDEIFNEGAGEDTDFCIRAEMAGYKMAVAGEMTNFEAGKHVVGSVPIFHKGEATVHDKTLVSGWNEIFERNGKILAERYPKIIVEERKEVLCIIPTKGRYFTTLPLAIASVISQTVKPDKLVIYDDGLHTDLRQNPTYNYLYKMLDEAGIKWEVSFGSGLGQHVGHQRANTSDFRFVWRLDDDTVAQPDVLEKLLSHMKDGVGAVGGSVIIPGGEAKSDKYGIKLLDVNSLPNIQWAKGEGVIDVEHLYSSFLYRTNIVDYNLTLSRVGHREETIFSHRLFRAGYRLLVDRSVITYHLRNPEGGIRTEKDTSLWQHDEEIFRKELEKWGYKMIALSHGLGDHLAFVNIIPELLKRCKTLVLFVVYGEVFDGIENVVVRPLGDAASFGIKEIGIYEWCSRYSWKKSLVKAYEKLYLEEQL